MKKVTYQIVVIVVFLIPIYIGVKSIISSFTTDYFQILEFLFGLFLTLPSLIAMNFIFSPVKIDGIDIQKKFKNLEAKQNYKMLSLVCIIVLAFAGFSSFQKSKMYNNDNFVTLIVTLSHDLKKNSKTQSIDNINSNEYPMLVFNPINRIEKKLIEGELYKRMKRNSSIKLYIHKNDYLKKIKKTKEPSFFEKYFDWKSVDFFGFSFNGVEYKLQSLDEYNKELKTDAFMYFSISIILLLAYFIKFR